MADLIVIPPTPKAAPSRHAPSGEKEERAAFHTRVLADLGACLRADFSEDETFYQVACLIGRLTHVSRATFGTVDVASGTITVKRDFCRDMPSMVGRYRVEDAMRTSEELASGLVVVINDVATDYRTSDAIASRLKMGYQACVGVPLRRDGVWSATFVVQSAIPYEWPQDELELFRTAAEWAWLASENAHLLREARAANAAKDRFLAVLSHELRTPLNPVALTLATWGNSPTLPPPLRADLEMMRRNIELETRLIDDLLDVTRITNGKLQLSMAPIRGNDLLREICRTCHPDATQQEVALDSELSASDDALLGDGVRLQQAIWNLVKNAIKFSPAGSRVVVRSSSAAGRFQVSVQDQGVGIAPEALPKIFNAFEQGGEIFTREFGGLGLGLAITKAVVELHGGSVVARSAGLGHGSTFEVGLPAYSPASAQHALIPATPPPDSPSPLGCLHILLVDDHADTLFIMGRLLQSQGPRVTMANSIREALAAAAHEQFDLLISDIGLPDGSGYELLAELRKIRAVPAAIAVSGYGAERDRQESDHAGFSAHLTKPIQLDRLWEVIRSVIGEIPRP